MPSSFLVDHLLGVNADWKYPQPSGVCGMNAVASMNQGFKSLAKDLAFRLRLPSPQGFRIFSSARVAASGAEKLVQTRPPVPAFPLLLLQANSFQTLVFYIIAKVEHLEQGPFKLVQHVVISQNFVSSSARFLQGPFDPIAPSSTGASSSLHSPRPTHKAESHPPVRLWARPIFETPCILIAPWNPKFFV